MLTISYLPLTAYMNCMLSVNPSVREYPMFCRGLIDVPGFALCLLDTELILYMQIHLMTY